MQRDRIALISLFAVEGCMNTACLSLPLNRGRGPQSVRGDP